MKRLLFLLPLLLLPLLAHGAANTNIINTSYDRSNGRFLLPTNASFSGLAIGTNKASITNGLHIRAAKSGTDYLTIDDTNGTRRFQVGRHPNSSAYGVLWVGKSLPTDLNYSVSADGGSTILNGEPDIYLGTANVPHWQIHSSGNFLATADATYRIGSPGANRPLSIDVSGYGTFGGDGTFMGNVGIGTTSPVSPLQVVGQITSGNNTINGQFRIPSVSNLGDLIVEMGESNINPPLVFGYNQRPGYVLDNSAFKGVSWIIEPDYTSPSTSNKVFEVYLQYLSTNYDQGSTLRPFMTQIDTVTGLPTDTIISAGDNLYLNINDGSGGFPRTQIGAQQLRVNKNAATFFGVAEAQTSLWLKGTNDSGTVTSLNFMDIASSQYWTIADRATALTSALSVSFNGGSELLHLHNDGKLGLGQSNPATVLHVKSALPTVYVEDTTAYSASPVSAIRFAGKYNTAGYRSGWSALQGGKENASDGNWAGYLDLLTSTDGAGDLTAKVRVTSTGNVGIGTNVPVTRLHVHGDVTVVGGGINSRTNIGAFDVSTNIFVLGTRYTNSNRRLFVAASAQLTAAAAGTASVSLYVENLGSATNRLTISAGPLASLITTEPLFLPVGPNMIYYFADETSGVGASASILGNTCSRTEW